MPGLTGHLKRIVRRIEIHIRLDRIRPVFRIILPENRQFRRFRLRKVDSGAETVPSDGFLDTGIKHLEDDTVILELDLGLGRMDVDVD